MSAANEDSVRLESQIREDTQSLMKSANYLYQGGIILPCQKRCLGFAEAEVSREEQLCLVRCVDEYTFFDKATYELDSATLLAS